MNLFRKTKPAQPPKGTAGAGAARGPGMMRSSSIANNIKQNKLNSIHDKFAGKHIRVCVCTGNMGNAKPNEESLQAWVPYNGNCLEVLEDPNYPIMFDEDDKVFEDNNEYGVVNEISSKVTDLKAESKRSLAGTMSTKNMVNGKASVRKSVLFSIDDDSSNLNELEDKLKDYNVNDYNNFDINNNNNASQSQLDIEEEAQFDIIAIGMQEATFDVDKIAKNNKIMDDNSEELGADNGTPANNADQTSVAFESNRDVAIQAASTANLVVKNKKKGGITAKVKKKASSAVTTLAADRDYHKEDNDNNYYNIRKNKKAVVIDPDTSILHHMLSEHLPNYKRIVSYQRGEMRLIIFKLDRTCPVIVHSVKAQNTGVAGLANKGGIAAELILNGSTRLSFMSAHLEAHEGIQKYNMRCSTLADILQGTKEFQYPPTAPDISLSSHYCFIMGDLNFRTRFTDENNGVNGQAYMQRARELVDFKIWQDLNAADELQKALKKKECLVGFETLYCNFPPTFKVDRRKGYIYNEKRTPSYTDRILWKTGHMLENSIKPLSYEPIDDFHTSDHKPMRGTFEIELHDRVVFGAKKALRRGNRRSSLSDFFVKGGDENVKEDLHLFITDMQCELKEDCTSSGQAPNPYVCIVSSPAACLLGNEDKFKQFKWLRSIFTSPLKTRTIKHIGEIMGAPLQEVERTAFGWPRNEKQKSTYKPDWTNKDIRCVLQTSSPDGKPIDVSGAILHITVFSHQTSPSTEDEWLGTYSFNLHHLLKTSQQKLEGPQHASASNLAKHKRTRKNSMQHNTRHQYHYDTNGAMENVGPHSSGGVGGGRVPSQMEEDTYNHSGHNDHTESSHGFSNSNPAHGPLGLAAFKRASVRNIMSTAGKAFRNASARSHFSSNMSSASGDSSNNEEDNIVTVQVEGSLTRNGKETGKITCTVEAWWMDENTAKIAIHGNFHDNNPHSLKVLGGRIFGGTANAFNGASSSFAVAGNRRSSVDHSMGGHHNESLRSMGSSGRPTRNQMR